MAMPATCRGAVGVRLGLAGNRLAGDGRSEVSFGAGAHKSHGELRPQQTRGRDGADRQQAQRSRTVGALALTAGRAATIVLIGDFAVCRTTLAVNTAVVHRVGIHYPARHGLRGHGLRVVGRSRTRYGELQADAQLKGQQREQNAEERLRAHEAKRTQFPDECRNDTEVRRASTERRLGIGRRSGRTQYQCR
jgi:hypothetical protein